MKQASAFLDRQRCGSVILALPRKFVLRRKSNNLTLFYDRLEEELTSVGIVVERIALNKRPHEVRGNQSKLILLHNGARSLPNVLNSGLSYIPGYWNIDRKGVRGMSSAGDLLFEPDTVDVDKAAAFCDSLREKYVFPRRSQYMQARDSSVLPERFIAVFFQGDNQEAQRTTRPSSARMLQSVALESGDLPIVVKHHPLRTSARDVRMIGLLRQKGVTIVETDANVHDILAGCLVTVSVSSGACFEGFLHSKPAIFFGRTDLKNFGYSAQCPDSFRQALDRALHDVKPFDQYVYWYLSSNCVDASKPDLWKAVLAKARHAGFDTKTL